MTDPEQFLSAGHFIDCDHPDVHQFAAKYSSVHWSAAQNAVALFLAVRDEVRYDVYIDYTDPNNFRASGVLGRKAGFCVGKAALLAALCRSVGVPARLGYSDVRNHMSSPRLQQMMLSDIFVWHSYAELYLGGRWVKAVPAFDAPLCERLGLPPLEFDGKSDALLHAFDKEGRRRMEYVQDRGVFVDVPFEIILEEFRSRYPRLIAGTSRLSADFRAEAQAGSG